MSLADSATNGVFGIPTFVIPKELRKDMMEGEDPIRVLQGAIGKKRKEISALENCQ